MYSLLTSSSAQGSLTDPSTGPGYGPHNFLEANSAYNISDSTASAYVNSSLSLATSFLNASSSVTPSLVDSRSDPDDAALGNTELVLPPSRFRPSANMTLNDIHASSRSDITASLEHNQTSAINIYNQSNRTNIDDISMHSMNDYILPQRRGGLDLDNLDYMNHSSTETAEHLMAELPMHGVYDLEVPAKRGRGRPRGSRNKNNMIASESVPLKRKPGRPRGSGKKIIQSDDESLPKRGPGRPRKIQTPLNIALGVSTSCCLLYI